MSDIEKLAREAQLVQADNADRAWTTEQCDGVLPATLERFAQAVARRCAEVCEDRMARTSFEPEAEACAKAIRAEFGIKEEP